MKMSHKYQYIAKKKKKNQANGFINMFYSIFSFYFLTASVNYITGIWF